jgi:hypothetical protein
VLGRLRNRVIEGAPLRPLRPEDEEERG